MRNFKLVLVILGFIPLATGLLDLLVGVEALQWIDPSIPTEAIWQPTLGSQIRFAGAIWFGYAALLALALSDLQRYATLLRLLFAIIFVSGIGRLLAQIQLGDPAVPFVWAMLLEIIGMPILLWWHRRLTRQPSER